MELDAEIKAQILACVESGDLQQVRDILDTLEGAENPNLVKVEFTFKQMRGLEEMRVASAYPSIESCLRLMVDNWLPAWRKGRSEAQRAKARG